MKDHTHAGCNPAAASKRHVTSPTEWGPELVELYQTERPSLIRLAQRLVDRRELAEDVVQDAFMRYHMAHNRPAKGREASYLRSIVLNNARSVLRRRQVSEAWRPSDPQTDPCTETEWLRRSERSDVIAALERLPGRQCEVIVLRYVFGLNERETATELKITIGSVKTHASRARATLASDLALSLAA